MPTPTGVATKNSSQEHVLDSDKEALVDPALRGDIQDIFAHITTYAAPVFQALIADVQDKEPVGDGREKIVYDYQPGRVVAFYKGYQSLEDLQREFYKRKLVQALLPGATPEVHLVSARPPLLIIDKVEGRTLAEEHTSIGDLEIVGQANDKFEALGLWIDDAPPNFVIDNSGNAVYVDSLGSRRKIDRAVLETAARTLPEARRVKAARYLQRLDALDAFV